MKISWSEVEIHKLQTSIYHLLCICMIVIFQLVIINKSFSCTYILHSSWKLDQFRILNWSWLQSFHKSEKKNHAVRWNYHKLIIQRLTSMRVGYQKKNKKNWQATGQGSCCGSESLLLIPPAQSWTLKKFKCEGVQWVNEKTKVTLTTI